MAPCLLLEAPAATPPAGVPADRSLLTVERIFGKDEFKTQAWGPARWLKDGSGYTTLEKSATHKEAKDIVRYEPETGRREVLAGASDLMPSGGSTPLKIDD
jgi:dipeptidyl-peptidase-4